MQIIEQSITPKSPKRESEDGIVVTADYIAVIDGSTSKSTHQFSSRRSNGRYAMELVAAYIRQAPRDLSCHQFCTGVTHYLRQRYTSLWQKLRYGNDLLQLLNHHPEERMAASAAVFSRMRREVWLIGDCQCLIGNNYYDNPKPCEAELAQLRANFIAQSPKPWDHFLERDSARQAILPRMLETMQQQNKRYAVIDGFTIAERHVPVITLDFQPWEIVLATDGYPWLCPTLYESEQRLLWQLQNDPLCIGQFKATKGVMKGQQSFDDRAYIRFKA